MAVQLAMGKNNHPVILGAILLKKNPDFCFF